MNISNKFLAALTLPVVGVSMAANVAEAQFNYQSPETVQEQSFDTEQSRKGRRGGMMKGFNEDITRSVEKISNGVVMTITTENEDLLEEIQNKQPRNNNEDETVSVVVLENGIQITKTSDDEDVVAKMHEHIDMHEERKAMRESVTKTVENILNGVVVTITSTDADVVEKIQSKEPKEHKNADVVVEQVLIDGGVQITITAEDEETIEKIQQRAQEGPRKRKGRGGKKGGLENQNQ